MIRYALRNKGVDQDVISVAVEQIDPQSELENAQYLVQRKIRSTRGLDPAKRTNRLVGMLARKGYGGLAYGVVREAIAADRQAEQAEDDELANDNDQPQP